MSDRRTRGGYPGGAGPVPTRPRGPGASFNPAAEIDRAVAAAFRPQTPVRAVLIGLGPPEGLRGSFGPESRSERFLADLGLPGDVPRINLCRRAADPAGLPDARLARAARRLRPDLAGYDLILLAGRRVARAFGLPDSWPFLRWYWIGSEKGYKHEAGAAIVPHPSSLNRWWNDPRHRQDARRFLDLHLRRQDFLTTVWKEADR